MKCTTNEELWEYQSTFLEKRSIHVAEEYTEKWFYNKSAVYIYMMKCTFRCTDDCNLEKEKARAIALLQNMKTTGDQFEYYGYTITLTNRPFPRLLSKKTDSRFVLIKRLDDIPILCKGPLGMTGDIWGDLSICMDEHWADFNLLKTFTVNAPWISEKTSVEDAAYTLGVWGNCVRNNALHGSLHYRDGIDEIVSGDVLITGVEDLYSRIPYAFDLRAYLQMKKEKDKDPRYFFDDYYSVISRDKNHPAFGHSIGLTEEEIALLFPDDIGGAYETSNSATGWSRYWIE